MDIDHWDHVNQLVWTIKPLVDAIGNLESHKASLADCMLELLHCARDLYRLQQEPSDDPAFSMYAKLVFTRQFHNINTPLHSLALFLHPSCRKLALSQATHGNTFEDMCKTSLGLARKWDWDAKTAGQMIDDMKEYHHCRGPFVGGCADAMEWWSSLPISSKQHPLKTLAITIFSIVPHAAEVERLFSDLGGVQGVRRC
jgi:hypothetical protein